MRPGDAQVAEMPEMLWRAAWAAGTSPIFDAHHACQIGQPSFDLDTAQCDLVQGLHHSAPIQRTAIAVAARIGIGLDLDLAFRVEERGHDMREMTLVGDPAPLQELRTVTSERCGQHWCIQAR
ncbi:hypothetical protein ABB33_06735 [Stenotrophomonas acidaminiphila]|nr:hypothetical protein ABB33_06735 [Stenotrophomonas acidaminiphila]